MRKLFKKESKEDKFWELGCSCDNVGLFETLFERLSVDEKEFAIGKWRHTKDGKSLLNICAEKNNFSIVSRIVNYVNSRVMF